MPLSPTDPGSRRPAVTANPLYGRGGELLSVPRDVMPEGELAPGVAAQLIRDELMLDGNARLNLATFVTTSMEPEARALMDECIDKNMIDKDEYPQTAELERRCVAMLAHLWHAPEGEATGCSTTGSSEAAMLAGMALKRRWQGARRAAGLDADRPNLVMGANVQVCWEKFANYWEVEPRYVPMQGDRYHLGAEEAAALCDERTIGVVTVLGSTFDGSYEPVAAIAAALDDLAARTGIDVPVHVDGASGAMVAPFVDPDLVWDFTLDRVASINTSGHKYGLVYPGVGWVLWRDRAALPEELVFHVDYLGGDMPTFALNFSRPGAQVVAQYYSFIRLGFDGYRRVQQASRDVALHLSAGIAELGPFALITDGSELPVFACTTGPGTDAFTVYDVSRGLRERGWLVPAYPFAADRTDLHALRFVVRNGFTHDLADLLLADLGRLLPRLTAGPTPGPSPHPAFHHRPAGGLARWVELGFRQTLAGSRRREHGEGVIRGSARVEEEHAGRTRGWPAAAAAGRPDQRRAARVAPAEDAVGGHRGVHVHLPSVRRVPQHQVAGRGRCRGLGGDPPRRRPRAGHVRRHAEEPRDLGHDRPRLSLGGIVSDDKGLYQPPKVMAVLGAGEELDYACNGHRIWASWDPRVPHQQMVLITDRRLLLVGKPSLFGKTAPVAMDIAWSRCHGVSGEPSGGWICIDLQTTDGALAICATATNAYEMETRARRHIARARDGS